MLLWLWSNIKLIDLHLNLSNNRLRTKTVKMVLSHARAYRSCTTNKYLESKAHSDWGRFKLINTAHDLWTISSLNFHFYLNQFSTNFYILACFALQIRYFSCTATESFSYRNLLCYNLLWIIRKCFFLCRFAYILFVCFFSFCFQHKKKLFWMLFLLCSLSLFTFQKITNFHLK